MKTNFYYFIILSIFLSINCSAHFDLKSIKHIAAKGRIQDKSFNPDIPVIDDMIKKGKESIPILIEMLMDETELQKGIIDYWQKVTVGDLSLIILVDFFTDSSWRKSTVDEASWNNLLGENSARLPFERRLREYIKKNGRRALFKKWSNIWSEYKDRLFWDKKDRCFKVN
jgi:hypothetical protein